MGSTAFDPNLVGYHYISTRILTSLLAQHEAGKARWRPTGITAKAPFVPISLNAAQRPTQSSFELVRSADALLDFGTLRNPGLYIKDTRVIEGYQVRTSEDGYRVALFKTTVPCTPALVLIGSIGNVVGAVPNESSSPSGFYPSFAGALEPMLQLFTTGRRRRRVRPLPANDPAAIQELVTEAADFAFDLGHSDDKDIRFLAARVELALAVWYEATDVSVGSFRRGERTSLEHVLVGTPLWIRDPQPQPVVT